MARRKVPFLPDSYYHVYNRGANRAEIFRGEQDYLLLLKLLQAHLREFAITAIAYCLMPNPYHLLLRQNGQTQISDFMQRVFHKYSLSFNHIHNHTGTLFEGPFQAIRIDRDPYLLHLCRYIHRNPLEGGMVVSPEQWRYQDQPCEGFQQAPRDLKSNLRKAFAQKRN